MAYPYPEDEREASNVFFVWEMFRPLLKGKPNKWLCSCCYRNNLTIDTGFNVEIMLFCTLNLDFSKKATNFRHSCYWEVLSLCMCCSPFHYNNTAAQKAVVPWHRFEIEISLANHEHYLFYRNFLPFVFRSHTLHNTRQCDLWPSIALSISEEIRHHAGSFYPFSIRGGAWRWRDPNWGCAEDYEVCLLAQPF